MPLPAGILVPVNAISVRGQCDHVGAAVAVEIRHGHLVAGGKAINEVFLEPERFRREQQGPEGERGQHGKTPLYRCERKQIHG